jgi:hypothetical protein
MIARSSSDRVLTFYSPVDWICKYWPVGSRIGAITDETAGTQTLAKSSEVMFKRGGENRLAAAVFRDGQDPGIAAISVHKVLANGAFNLTGNER